jgi:hypothetical protein
LIAFFALVLGAIAAALGARLGAARSQREYADQRIIRGRSTGAGI